MRKKRPAVFLDRDGTLIRERGYLSRVGPMKFYDAAIPALRALQKAGLPLVVVTNQSGVARGYLTLKTLAAIHRRMTLDLKKKGVRLSGIYFCPHGPGDGCPCRKPKPGLPRRAARALGLDLRRSFVVGDQLRDVQLATAIGATPILVLTGAGRLHRKKALQARVKVASNLLSASRWILKKVHS